MLKRSAIMGFVAIAMTNSYRAGNDVLGVTVQQSSMSMCTTRRGDVALNKNKMKMLM